MGDELEATPGAENGSQGQAADSTTDQGPGSTHIDFSQTPDGRAFMSNVQSAADRKTAEERRRADAAEAKAAEYQRTVEQLQAQVDAIVGTIQSSDPEAAKLVVTEAAQKASQTELKQLREQLADITQKQEADRQAKEASQRAEYEFYAYWTSMAQQQGLDPNNPDYQAALRNGWSNNNGTVVGEALINLAINKRQGGSMSISQEPDFVSPPSGGTAPKKKLSEQEREAMHGQLNELYAEPTKNAAKIAALRSRLGL